MKLTVKQLKEISSIFSHSRDYHRNLVISASQTPDVYDLIAQYIDIHDLLANIKLDIPEEFIWHSKKK